MEWRLTPDPMLSCHVSRILSFVLEILKKLCVKAGVKQMPLLNLAHIDEKNKITGGRKGGCVSIRWPLFESGRVPYELCKQSRCLLQNPFKQVGNRLSCLCVW